MHNLLQDQLKQYGLDPATMPAEWQALLQAVTATYQQLDSERASLAQSLEQISHELLAANRDMQQTNKDLREQTQLLENLVIVAQSTTGHSSLEDTVRSVLDVAILLTNSETGGRSSLFLFDEKGAATLTVLARKQTITKAPDQRVRAFITKGLTGWVAQHRQLALIEDTSQDERWLPSAEDVYTARSAICLPIESGSQLLGVLTLTHPELNHFSQDHAWILDTASSQIALALRNAQLHHEQFEQAQRQHTLYETLRTVGSYLDPETVAQEAVSAVARLTQWQTLAILLPDENGHCLTVRATAGKIFVPMNWSIPVNEGVIGRTFRTGQTQYVANVSTDPDYVVLDPAVNSELVVPLRRGQRVLGVLDLESYELDDFDEAGIRLAESLAEAIGLALDNAHLHKELGEAKELAEAANKAKSEFISVASHELKNPMTSIKGYAEILANGLVGATNEQQAEFLKTILLNVSRMQTIVSDLTDISQIEAGHIRIKLTPVPVSDVVDEVIHSLQTQIEASRQELRVTIPETLPPVLADRFRLMQIVTNLLSNAHKYTPAGGQIMISASLNNGANGSLAPTMVLITIRDNGIGISAEDQDRLFRKFFRSADPLARQAPGTGLGLNITKNLVEIHGGEIWFESEHRQGTSFHFTLPVYNH
jgi:signal transduction histidine kinase